MDCRETQTLLTAFHDGELPGPDRVLAEEHLRGCPACNALLADLARVDRAAGVPDPGEAYWGRFNARVMDRIERETDGRRVKPLRPKGGWTREQLRYLVPAAAAALVLMIVHYGGTRPGAPVPEVPSAVSRPETQDTTGDRKAGEAAERRAAKKPVGMAAARRLTAPPLTGEQPAAAPVTEQDGMRREAQAERKKVPEASDLMSAKQVSGSTISPSGAGIAKESAPAPPCALARTLAERERIREAEASQRACLEGNLDAPSREKGLVFLAELLDRQGRFSDADTVIAEVEKQYPGSRPLDLYRRERPMVQKEPAAVPVTR